MARSQADLVIAVVCRTFGVERGRLARSKVREAVRDVTWARAACAMLARESAGISVTAMGRRIGYTSRYLVVLNNYGRTWLRWAAQEKLSRRRWDVALFRRRFEEACRQLGVNVEKIAGVGKR